MIGEYILCAIFSVPIIYAFSVYITDLIKYKRITKGVVEEKYPSYSDYLNSPEWWEKRESAIARAGYRCQLCGASNVRFNVHHNTYTNLYDELPIDLICLCRKCHKKFHNR